MGLFDKQNLSKALDVAKGSSKNLAEKVKESSKEIRSGIAEYSGESKEMKAPVDGAIIRYSVIYLGGLAEYPKKQSGEIGFNILPDKFVLKATSASKWFEGLEIPYSKVKEFKIVPRTVSNTEMLLAATSTNMDSLKQENNINITYDDENGHEVMLRIEMLTGISVYGQAGKCREMLDVLRQNNILNQLNKSSNPQPAVQADDPFEQIKKLQELKELGVLSDEEFNSKKAELLAKI